MSAIISLGLNKDKIVFNEKGWANVTIFLDDNTNPYGQNASAIMEQTKEQRESKQARVYLGNGKIVWTDGNISVATKVESQVTGSQQSTAGRETTDLPF